MNDRPIILAGIGGGIAAYKAVEVVSRLAQAGREVRVAMTAAAQRFVTPTTFASVSRRTARICSRISTRRAVRMR
jgi:phosphopantothenoylcysteine decarboxylase/phosphopantothenate--cysteine ligase